MRVRTFCGVLVALGAIVAVSYLSQKNIGLMTAPFEVSDARSVPLFVIFVAVFLLGFLPPVAALLAKTAGEDLERRKLRKQQRDELSSQSAFRRGVDYQLDGQWSRAEREFSTVLEHRPEDFSALLRQGQVLRQQGHIDEALEVHRRASVLFPHNVGLLFELAENYTRRGDSEVASEIRNRILRDFPEAGLRVARRRRSSALEASSWAEAAKWQEKVESLVAESGDTEEVAKEGSIRRGLSYQRAMFELENDEVEQAKTRLHELLEEQELFVPAAILLGEAALLEADPEGAVTAWKQGYERTGSPVFLQRIEDHFIERNEPVRAIENLRHLIASADSDLFPRFFLGRLYYRLEMHGEALKLLEPLGDRIESSPTLHLLLARISERLGQVEEASKHYQLCIQEAEIDRAGLFCRSCDARYPDWRDRCSQCGSWNSVEVDLREESLSPEELGVRSAPVWSVYERDFLK